ncbi:MAG TPA: hypothetical protein DEA80_14245 [Afipia sp.]|nr:hypothetical protein [Afipia sp.]OUX62397.1 MAG: hypothetical protein CBB64_04630 [Afipia sp. TMED4]HAO43744.1 hypothetical protein [Afipia sp.]HAP13499.1 hypothetical protein [Afipia sp.]HAP46954.1 hypothetical protein [Afipia sp.]
MTRSPKHSAAPTIAIGADRQMSHGEVDKGTHRDQGVFFEQRQSARKGWSCCRHFVSNAIDCLPGAYLSNSPAGLRK